MYWDKSIWWELYALPKLQRVFTVHDYDGRFSFRTKQFGVVTVWPKEDWVECTRGDFKGCAGLSTWFTENIFSHYKISYRDMYYIKSRFEIEVQAFVPLGAFRIDIQGGLLIVSPEGAGSLKFISEMFLNSFCRAHRLTWTRDGSLAIFLSSYYFLCDDV